MRGPLPLSLTVLGLTFLSFPAGASNFCTDSTWVANAAVFDPDLANFSCGEVSRTTVDGVQLHIVQDTRKMEPAAADLSGLIVSAAKAALDQYKALNPALAYHDINLVLSPYVGQDGVQAGATSDLHNECLMVVFTGSPDVMDPTKRAAELPNTIAHELFHCVQYWTVPAQMKADKRNWWIEGSAEAMAQTVFDAQERYNTLNDQFQISPKPLTQLVYPSYVFFAWLLQTRGAAGLFAFMSGMPQVNGEAAQRQALLSQVTPDQLNRFAEAWVDGTIQTPQGWTLLAPGDQGHTQTFTGSATLGWPVGPPDSGGGPFTVQWGVARFKNGRYALTVTDELAPAARFAQVPGLWAKPPEQVGAPCGVPATLRFAGFNSKDGAVRLTMKAQVDVSDTGPLPEHDSCLNGSWVLDATGVENAVNAAVPGANPKPAVNGGISLTLPGGGQDMVYSFNDYDLYLGLDSPAAETIELGITGSARGSWSTRSATHKLRLCPDSNDVVATTTVQVFSTAGTVTDVQKLAGTDLVDSTYTCTATTLTLSTSSPSQATPNSTVYKRPGAADSLPVGTPAGSGVQQSKGCQTGPGPGAGLGALVALLGLRRRVRR